MSSKPFKVIFINLVVRLSKVSKEIGIHFKLKEESIGDPDIYLGGKVRKHEYQTKDGIKKCWSFSSLQYVQNACSNVLNFFCRKQDLDSK